MWDTPPHLASISILKLISIKIIKNLKSQSATTISKRKDQVECYLYNTSVISHIAKLFRTLSLDSFGSEMKTILLCRIVVSLPFYR